MERLFHARDHDGGHEHKPNLPKNCTSPLSAALGGVCQAGKAFFWPFATGAFNRHDQI
jgi:hypothetical protein